jgi:hypothetical protein
MERTPLQFKTVSVLAVVFVLLITPSFAETVSAQEQPNYCATVKPISADLPQYMSIGRTVTVPFEAQWTYGPNNGRLIENATATIAITNQKGELVGTIITNTTTGLFVVNYTQNKPNILSFNATKLVTQDGQELTSDPVDSSNSTYGITSSYARVYWDTFHISIVSYNTDSLQNIDAKFNVTRLLLPQEGLTTRDNVHISKIAVGVIVTINGVLAQEIEPGIYSARSSTWLSTAYVNVKVSSVSWTTSATGFSFIHNANQPFWTYAVGFGIICVSAVLVLGFLISKKTNNQMTKPSSLPFIGGVTLTSTCIINLYWTFVALEATMHAFEWALLAVFGVFSAMLGLVGAVMLLRQKHPALVMTAVMVPMIMNTLAVNASLGMYQLGNPWIWLFASLFLSIISAIFISRTEMFQKQSTIAAN